MKTQNWKTSTWFTYIVQISKIILLPCYSTPSCGPKHCYFLNYRPSSDTKNFNIKITFFFFATWLVAFQFPNQGLNLGHGILES